MGSRWRVIVAFFATLACWGCGSEQSEPKSADDAQEPAPAPTPKRDEDAATPLGFKRIEERAIGFSVIVPEGAEKREVKREGVAPGAWMWLGQTDEGSVYTVAYFGELGLDESNLDEQLAQAVIGIVQGCGGQVLNAKRGEISWGAIVVFAGVCSEGEPVIGRLHVQRGKMYAVFAIAKSPAARENVRAFLSSFREVR